MESVRACKCILQMQKLWPAQCANAYLTYLRGGRSDKALAAFSGGACCEAVQLQNSSALELSKTSNCIIYLRTFSAGECSSLGSECNDEVSDVIRCGSNPVLTTRQLARYLSRWPPNPSRFSLSRLFATNPTDTSNIENHLSYCSQGSVPIELPTDRSKLFITK